MATVVRMLALAVTAIVALSLLMFVVADADEGTQNQIRRVQGTELKASGAELSRPNPSANVERVREGVHGSFHEKVDDANDILLSPFTSFTDFESVWASRLAPGALALLLYGFGGLLLANALPRQRREVRDWREVSD